MSIHDRVQPKGRQVVPGTLLDHPGGEAKSPQPLCKVFEKAACSVQSRWRQVDIPKAVGHGTMAEGEAKGNAEVLSQLHVGHITQIIRGPTPNVLWKMRSFSIHDHTANVPQKKIEIESRRH